MNNSSFDARLASAYAGRKVLVVGADGFIGYNCAQRLAQLGADVTILSRHQPSRAARFGHRCIQGDLANPECVLQALSGQSVVLDLAGASGAEASNLDPVGNIDAELVPHLNLFWQAANQPTSPHLVFISSRLVYGAPRTLPVRESHPLQPNSAYAVHKIALEQHLAWLASGHDLPYTALRLSNPYGSGYDLEGRSYGIINRFIDLISNGEAVTVYGDGDQLRDYLYIDDAVNAILASAVEPATINRILNLGSGQGIALREAIDVIGCTVGQSPRIVSTDWPEAALRVETGDYVSDISALLAALELPAFLGFKEGIAATMGKTISTGAFA